MVLNPPAAWSMRASTAASASFGLTDVAGKAIRSRTVAVELIRILIKTDSCKWGRLWRGKRHITFHLLLGIDDRLHAENVIFLPRVRFQKRAGSRGPLCFGSVAELFGIHPEDVRAVLGRKHDDAAGPRLVAKHIAGREEYKRQNQP